MRRHVYNDPAMLERRRALRRAQTPAEAKMWERLRNRRLNGFKFFRQYSVDSYVIDFYCPKRRLAVEIDGEHHADEETVEYDAIRTAVLESVDIRVIRFWNDEVMNEIEGVMARIAQALEP